LQMKVTFIVIKYLKCCLILFTKPNSSLVWAMFKLEFSGGNTLTLQHINLTRYPTVFGIEYKNAPSNRSYLKEIAHARSVSQFGTRRVDNKGAVCKHSRIRRAFFFLPRSLLNHFRLEQQSRAHGKWIFILGKKLSDVNFKRGFPTE